MSIERVCKDEPSSLWEYKPHTAETVWRQLGSSQLLLSLIQGLYIVDRCWDLGAVLENGIYKVMKSETSDDKAQE